MQISRSVMNVLAFPALPPSNYNYTNGDEATGYSSDEDFYEDYCDYSTQPPTSTRNWDVRKLNIISL